MVYRLAIHDRTSRLIVLEGSLGPRAVALLSRRHLQRTPLVDPLALFQGFAYCAVMQHYARYGIPALVIVGAALLGLTYTYIQFPDTQTVSGDTTPQEVVETAKSQEQVVFVDGIIVRDGPNLKPDVWYIGFEEEGKDIGVELMFDEGSICRGRTASGTCVPEYFVNGRTVHIEGFVRGEILYVADMTFTQPLDTAKTK